LLLAAFANRGLRLRTELVWGSIRPTLRHPLSPPGSFEKNFDPFNPGTTNVPGERLHFSVVYEEQFKSMERIRNRSGAHLEPLPAVLRRKWSFYRSADVKTGFMPRLGKKNQTAATSRNPSPDCWVSTHAESRLCPPLGIDLCPNARDTGGSARVKSRSLEKMQKAIGFSKHPLVTNQVENSPSPTPRQPWDQAVLWLPDPNKKQIANSSPRR
jgi:hypothetical protein